MMTTLVTQFFLWKMEKPQVKDKERLEVVLLCLYQQYDVITAAMTLGR